MILPGLLVACLPVVTLASLSTSLTWQASSDPNANGYEIFYGTASHQYTNSLTVGAVTNAIIPGLQQNTPYYFAAKTTTSAGAVSDFSNEALFLGVTTAPESALQMQVLPNNSSSDPLRFSLGDGAPADVSLNPTNGILTWTPGLDYTDTTNYLTVAVTDQANPAASVYETLMIVVGGNLGVQWGSAAVSAGQTGSLPLFVSSSSVATSVQLVVAWPDSALLNPTLTVNAPGATGTLVHGANQLVIQLQTDGSQSLAGTTPVAQIDFQTASGQPSAIYTVATSGATGSAANGTAYAGSSVASTEVAVIGDQPILRPQPSAAAGRALTLFAQPGTYLLQYTTSLAAPANWTTLATYQQTNVLQTVALDSENPIIFYRLQKL